MWIRFPRDALDKQRIVVYTSGTMKNKTLAPKKLRFFPIRDYPITGSIDCSGCGTGNVNNGEQIFGNLRGSGSMPFLILCPDCKKDLVEYLTK